jgi:hypothetical protein
VFVSGSFDRRSAIEFMAFVLTSSRQRDRLRVLRRTRRRRTGQPPEASDAPPIVTGAT